ncbi:hypothetical protein PAAG_00710 [Paracoccidioides lutzii Pb01]|uniref:Transmembrane protein n=1 Tax=Paracoccidioides lutzii (strain ATCC MYA-826 / Pb01) TaxID=502779 RepID=C1GQB5_PARBA|nr:hypothetical protein PAAG_00710 [Paracoccidioides lutzii Pb01]EEH37789.2 hypothetical protein PAAG_00710 [Paracoccidioides lutzii Pb01]
MFSRQTSKRGPSVPTLSLLTIYFVFVLTLTLSTALPIESHMKSVDALQSPNAYKPRSLPGSLLTAPKGAVGDPPQPASGPLRHAQVMEPKKQPIYVTLLVIAVFLGVIVAVYESL